MTGLDFLLLCATATAILLFARGDRPEAGWLATGAYAVQLLVLLTIGGVSSQASFSFTIQGDTVSWQMSGLGWFFGLITVAAALFAAWYSAGDWGKQQAHMRVQHTALALNVLAMLILLSSADLLSLFIGWELVSWASYLIMTQRGGKAGDAAFRYLLYAMAGAMAILAAITLIAVRLNTLSLEVFWLSLPTLPSDLLWTLLLLFGAGFGIKMALLPFHLWQPEAYAETPGASATFLNAIAGRMGLFALLLVLLHPLGLERLAHLADPLLQFVDARTLLAWLAALTAIIPTFIALQQTDARLLLAWHGIGQGGLMLLGIMTGSSLGVAGGLLHVFNYATYQAALFFVVTSVAYRTGTTDLDRLGGLITRMPWSYVALLMGIIGLAGLPPMNGFVSKWMIYKALIDAQMPLLLVAASISTLGTILSVYKLIHNMFLGQLRPAHYAVKEAPWSMTLPALILAGIGFLTGMMPGLALDLVDKAQLALGYALVPHHLGGMVHPGGGLNMLWVVGILIYGIAIGALIFFLGNRRHLTHQWDNYAGGHFLSADTPYHYSAHFYPGVMRVIGPWLRGQVLHLELSLRHVVHVLADACHAFYQPTHAVLYVLIAAVLALAWTL